MVTMSTVTPSSTGTAAWRAERPFLGAVLLLVAGVIVGYVPLQFTMELLLVGGAFTAIGLVFAVLLFLTGVFALVRPDLSTILGIAGVAFSILSVVGGLGGLLIGLLIGIVGSNLLIAWQPPGTREESITPPAGAGTGTAPATTETDVSWQEAPDAQRTDTSEEDVGTTFDPEREPTGEGEKEDDDEDDKDDDDRLEFSWQD